MENGDPPGSPFSIWETAQGFRLTLLYATLLFVVHVPQDKNPKITKDYV